MTTKMTKMAAMMVLAIGLMAGSATAQKSDGVIPAGLIYTGSQSNHGACVSLNEMCYGNTFVLTSHGEWESYHLTVSLNYSRAQFVPQNFVVTGGSWSMVVVRDNQYAGTLHGEVVSGNVSLVSNSAGEPTSKRVQMNLTSNGGWGIFGPQAGIGISGVYDMTTNVRTEATTGSASFGF